MVAYDHTNAYSEGMEFGEGTSYFHAQNQIRVHTERDDTIVQRIAFVLCVTLIYFGEILYNIIRSMKYWEGNNSNGMQPAVPSTAKI